MDEQNNYQNETQTKPAEQSAATNSKNSEEKNRMLLYAIALAVIVLLICAGLYFFFNRSSKITTDYNSTQQTRNLDTTQKQQASMEKISPKEKYLSYYDNYKNLNTYDISYELTDMPSYMVDEVSSIVVRTAKKNNIIKTSYEYNFDEEEYNMKTELLKIDNDYYVCGSYDEEAKCYKMEREIELDRNLALEEMAGIDEGVQDIEFVQEKSIAGIKCDLFRVADDKENLKKYFLIGAQFDFETATVTKEVCFSKQNNLPLSIKITSKYFNQTETLFNFTAKNIETNVENSQLLPLIPFNTEGGRLR